MKKINKFFIAMISVTLVCQITTSEEKFSSDYSIVVSSWEKAVIVDNSICGLLPHNLKTGGNQPVDLYPSVLLFSDSLQFNERFTYSSIPLKIDTDIVSCKKKYSIAFQLYSENHPLTWDLSNRRELYCNDIFEGSIREIYIRLKRYEKSKDYKLNYEEFFQYKQKTIVYNKVYNPEFEKYVDENGNTAYKQKNFDPNNGVNLKIITNLDDTLNVFLFNRKQVLVWNVDFTPEARKNKKEWKFEYAFKMPRTSHFEVCRIGNNLYILTNEYGIYRLSISEAKKYAPEPPKDVIKDYSSSQSLVWDGFQQEHIVKNEVKAKKVSDLNYDRYIVDKDHNTAYVVADGYLYELYNLKIRSKIPELRETENFIDKEAEYMRAVLKAIYNLGSKPEKTPAEILKVTPDSEVDKALAEKEAKNGNNSITDDDDKDTDDKTNSGNGDGDADADNSGTSTSKVGDKEDGKDSTGDTADSKAAIDAGNIDKNVPDSESKSDEISDSTDVFTYVSISAGILILLTIIFLVLVRKRR